MIALLATKRSQEQHREKDRFEDSLAPRPMDLLAVTARTSSRHSFREREFTDNLATSVAGMSVRFDTLRK
jgi:hypothetical protein